MDREHIEDQSQPQPPGRIPIVIPTYDQVLQQSRSQAAPLLFRPPSSASSPLSVEASPSKSVMSTSVISGSEQPQNFNQAFSFLRNTNSYTPPPAPSLPSTPPISGARSPAGVTLPKEVAAGPQVRNTILVSRRQQGNPVLKHIKNVRWTFSDIVPDYILGHSSCALYLSLRYHLLHPDYIYFRIRELMKSFRLRIILCYVDVEDVVKPLHEVTKTTLLHDCTLLCAWSLEECARYLETIKTYENKPADDIQERTDHDYLSRLTNTLKTIRHVNKTDVLTLGSTFGTLAAIMGASMEDLARCPGIGERKVKRVYDAFHEPFRRKVKQAVLTELNFKLSKKEACHENSEEVVHDIANVPEALDASVREALDAAYAIHRGRGEAQSGTSNNSETNNAEFTKGEENQVKC